ncbi:hypothetical protein OEZ86_003513 [Tetradesmus obliquus]|nr:hypothetical protein OEZ86_003513 [Tetradesmus obliquus]
MEAERDKQKIYVQIVGDHGLVWSVPDILKLRLEHRLVGCMVGGITGFKNQVSVGGLPLKLSPEEVKLALAAGWVQLHQTCFCIPTGRTATQQQQQQQAATSKQAAASAAAVAVAAGQGDSNSKTDGITAADSIQPSTLQPVQWSFPHTQQQRLRMAVFADLHSRGYFLTSGSKFGGDFLAYPGDPNLYHAQFVVRVLPLGQVLNPVLFKGLARGVHAARKHLLLASVVCSSGDGEGGDGREEGRQQQQQQQESEMDCQDCGKAGSSGGGANVVYITVAKEDGFGASK